MPTAEQLELIQAARDASQNAVAPYSGINVGVALRTDNGQIVTGCNVESASYGLTCCGERVALFSALSAGHRVFRSLALVSSIKPHLVPCGACRQLLVEHAPGIDVLCTGMDEDDSVDEFVLEDLLPSALSKLP
ncbi:MAG: cytidine deaminase [Limisphaerales bacterium]